MSPIVVDTIVLGGITLEVERPADAESLISEERFGDREFLPYWAELWPAGIALAMEAATRVSPGVTVLEIGAGLALPSLVAAAKGASVVALDWAPEAIDLLRANAARNRLASVQAFECEWSDLAAITAVQSELVFAADVLYEARNVEPVAAALAAGLSPAGRALVADPGRTHAGRFAAAALQHGLELDTGLLPTLPRGVLFELRHGPSPPPPPQT